MKEQKYQVFKSENGIKLALYSKISEDKNPLFSPDGETFYEFITSGLSSSRTGNNVDETILIDSPQLNFKGEIHRINEEVTFLGMKFSRTGEEYTGINTVPLPDDRKVEYLCFSSDGSFCICVTARIYKYSYDTLRFFIGDSTTMREINITGFNRWHDGGTTYIQTSEGVFFSPTAFENNRLPTWKVGDSAQPLLRKDPVLYKVVEDESGMVKSIVLM